MTDRPKCWPLPGAIQARTGAAAQMLPSLPEQFSALDPHLQLRLSGVLDEIAGQSHQEKVETRLQLLGMRQMPQITEATADLLAVLDLLVFKVDRLATPVVDGEPTGSLAERILGRLVTKHPDLADEGSAA